MKNNQTVVWASSEPFDVPAYCTGEWGEYVKGLDGLEFTPTLADAKVLTAAEQRQYAVQYKGAKRFYDAAQYQLMLERADEARGF